MVNITPQFKNHPKARAFTLIELLVMVACVALLATIVTVRVRDARLKANDVKIRENLLMIIKLAEEQLGETGLGYDAVCDDSNNTLTDTGNFGVIEQDIQRYNSNKTVRCIESADEKAYAVSSPMFYYATHWCVDSRAVSKAIASELAAGQSQCP